MKLVVSHQLITGQIYRDGIGKRSTKFRFLGDFDSENDLFIPITECYQKYSWFNQDGTITSGKVYTGTSNPWYYFEEDNVKLGKK